MSLHRTPLSAFVDTTIVKKIFAQSMGLLLCVVLLSACGSAFTLFGDTESQGYGPKSAEVGEVIDPMMSAPPHSNERPPQAGQTGTQYMPNGMPAIQPRGVNTDSLFADNIDNVNQRFSRVENAVIELRQEFNAVMPSIVRLVAVEQDMQDLISELELLLRNEPPRSAASSVRAGEQGARATPTGTGGPAALAPPETVWVYPNSGQSPQAKPKTVSPMKSVAPKHNATQYSTPTVMSARIGEHADKTRIVLDVSHKVQYKYDIDNEENLLVVDLAGVDWAGQKTWKGGKVNKLFSSYSVQPMQDGNGSRLIMAMKSNAQVIKELVLPPNGTSYYRIVLDVMSPGIHQ